MKCSHLNKQLVRFRHYEGDFVAYQCLDCGWVLQTEEPPAEALWDKSLPALDEAAYGAAIDQRLVDLRPPLRTSAQAHRAQQFLWNGNLRRRR